jgi:N-acetylglucosaminyl-diphospho-decaprenol L-rhamnosyltransferase
VTGGPAVTIAVVSWNTRELLARCLESMRADADVGLAEVWVVDNASGDGSAEMVRERFDWVRLHASDDNLGFGPAVNLVAERTESDWIAPSNADIEFEPGALAALLDAAEADPAAGSLAPRLVTPDGASQHSVHSFPSLHLALAVNLGLAAVVPGLGDRLCLERRWDPERKRRLDWAHGAFLLVRRSAFEAVGRFDPAQWMYAEDLDLAWRLAEAGWATRYVPAARVRHEVSAAARQAFAEQRRERHMAAAQDWMRRRRGVAVARAYAAINALGSAVRLGALIPMARLRPAKYAGRRELEADYLRLHRAGLR